MSAVMEAIGGVVDAVGSAVGDVVDFVGENPLILAAAIPFIGPAALAGAGMAEGATMLVGEGLGAFAPTLAGEAAASAAGASALGGTGALMSGLGDTIADLAGSTLEGAALPIEQVTAATATDPFTQAALGNMSGAVSGTGLSTLPSSVLSSSQAFGAPLSESLFAPSLEGLGSGASSLSGLESLGQIGSMLPGEIPIPEINTGGLPTNTEFPSLPNETIAPNPPDPNPPSLLDQAQSIYNQINDSPLNQVRKGVNTVKSVNNLLNPQQPKQRAPQPLQSMATIPSFTPTDPFGKRNFQSVYGRI